MVCAARGRAPVIARGHQASRSAPATSLHELMLSCGTVMPRTSGQWAVYDIGSMVHAGCSRCPTAAAARAWCKAVCDLCALSGGHGQQLHVRACKKPRARRWGSPPEQLWYFFKLPFMVLVWRLISFERVMGPVRFGMQTMLAACLAADRRWPADATQRLADRDSASTIPDEEAQRPNFHPPLRTV